MSVTSRDIPGIGTVYFRSPKMSVLRKMAGSTGETDEQRNYLRSLELIVACCVTADGKPRYASVEAVEDEPMEAYVPLAEAVREIVNPPGEVSKNGSSPTLSGDSASG